MAESSGRTAKSSGSGAGKGAVSAEQVSYGEGPEGSPLGPERAPAAAAGFLSRPAFAWATGRAGSWRSPRGSEGRESHAPRVLGETPGREPRDSGSG